MFDKEHLLPVPGAVRLLRRSPLALQVPQFDPTRGPIDGVAAALRARRRRGDAQGRDQRKQRATDPRGVHSRGEHKVTNRTPVTTSREPRPRAGVIVR